MKTYIFPNTFTEEDYGDIKGFYEYLEGYLREKTEYFHTDSAETPCRIILLVDGKNLEGELFIESKNDYKNQPVDGKYRYGYVVSSIWKYKHPISFKEFIKKSGYDKVVKNYRASVEDNQYFVLQKMIDPVKLL